VVSGSISDKVADAIASSLSSTFSSPYRWWKSTINEKSNDHSKREPSFTDEEFQIQIFLDRFDRSAVMEAQDITSKILTQPYPVSQILAEFSDSCSD